MKLGLGKPQTRPRVDEEMGVVFVADLADGTELGYKYFDFHGEERLKITYRGTGSGSLEVRTDPLLPAPGCFR